MFVDQLSCLTFIRNYMAEMSDTRNTSSRNSYFENEAKGKTFVVKMNFIRMRVKNHFNISDLISLALKQRLKETQKWPNIAHHPWSQKCHLDYH